MQADIKEFLTGRGIEWEEVDDLAKVAGDVDVLYQTRIQKERFQVPLPMPSAHQAAASDLRPSLAVAHSGSRH